MFLEKLLAATDTKADKLAVADPFRELSYGQLTTFAQVMRGIITKESTCERVGIVMPGSSAFVGTLFGCMWAGRVAIPLNFLLQPAELEKVVRDSGIDLILTVDHFREQVEALGVKTVYLEKAGLKRKFLFSKIKSTPTVPTVAEDQTAVILYTSGTSGEPKGVELSFGNLMSNCRDSVAHARIDREHVLLSVLPPFHVFGLTAMTLLPIWLGMTVHYLPRFNPLATVRTIEQKRISIMMAIPSMYTAIQRVKRASKESFESIYLALSGGEPLQASTAQAFEEKFAVRINEGYGLTETSPVVSMNMPWDFTAGAVGKVIPNCEVRIASPDGAALPANQDGEIQIKGPGVMKGYYRRAEETAAVMAEGGWFKTGDQGRLDDAGFLSITGRLKEMMIVGGENVFPREIESVLEQHPSVEEVAVIGQPDSSRGEVPVAFVIPAEGVEADENELRSLCRERLASFKVPRRIHIRADLPRGPTGKIFKRQLKEYLGD